MKKRVIRWVILLSIGFGLGLAIKHHKSGDSITHTQMHDDAMPVSSDDVEQGYATNR